MANPAEVLRFMLQTSQDFVQMQRDMKGQANAWRTLALAASTPVSTIAGFMNTSAASWQARLDRFDAKRAANPTGWQQVATMWALLGGTAQDFTDLLTPLRAVASQLGPAQKTTYAQIIAACDQIIAGVPDTFGLWD